jgi:ADP-ribosylglycohydrolase/predicted enzyme related to lactoylglutathione lyase
MTSTNHPPEDRSLSARCEAAFLAAAVGDALGWPEENRSQRLDQAAQGWAGTAFEFVRWKRKSGGRFRPWVEVINPGEYSDDTQLLIATARSLVKQRHRWWQHFCEAELPFWLSYERGGGGATKRSAESWSAGVAPWNAKNTTDIRRYFDAGGNGVAMRILPHVLRANGQDAFKRVANEVVMNGLATHGHPRALVGALAYAYALWSQLRTSSTLRYGALLDNVLSGRRDWADFPDAGELPKDWLQRAENAELPDYRALWMSVVEEQLALLNEALRGISHGALTVDTDILQHLGTFDKRVGGAGTVAVASALFLASRFAADPVAGLRLAASARGADTDTLASLTGGLLGAVHGSDWLNPLPASLQDAPFIRSLARAVMSNMASVTEEEQVGQVSQKAFGSPYEMEPGAELRLPIGVQAVVLHASEHALKSGSGAWRTACVRSVDGQLFFLKQFVSTKHRTVGPAAAPRFERVAAERLIVKLRVRDLARSKEFYVNAVGVAVTKERHEMLTLASGLALDARDQRIPQQFTLEHSDAPTRIYIETLHLDATLRNLKKLGWARPSAILKRERGRFFTCPDPDGNIVEVLEVGQN